jgi:hypothetical protein
VKEKPPTILKREKVPLYERIRQILESVRTRVARTVNTTQVVANWLIGREIVEEEQQGETKADYGKHLLADLSARLKQDFGTGYSVDNLEMFRRFYCEYSTLISEAMSQKLDVSVISDAPRRKLPPEETKIGHALRGQSWQPGQLHPNLSWTHYPNPSASGKVRSPCLLRD